MSRCRKESFRLEEKNADNFLPGDGLLTGGKSKTPTGVGWREKTKCVTAIVKQRAQICLPRGKKISGVANVLRE
jgi:hypothetical protein